VAVNRLIRIICASHNRGRSDLRSVMNSPCRSAAGIIGSCIRMEAKLLGGKLSILMQCYLRGSFGSKLTQIKYSKDSMLNPSKQ